MVDTTGAVELVRFRSSFFMAFVVKH